MGVDKATMRHWSYILGLTALGLAILLPCLGFIQVLVSKPRGPSLFPDAVAFLTLIAVIVSGPLLILALLCRSRYQFHLLHSRTERGFELP